MCHWLATTYFPTFHDSPSFIMAEVSGLSQLLNEKLYLLLPTIVTLLAVIIVPKLLSRDPLRHIPAIGLELGSDDKRRQAYLLNSRALYQQGYQKVSIVRPE